MLSTYDVWPCLALPVQERVGEGGGGGEVSVVLEEIKPAVAGRLRITKKELREKGVGKGGGGHIDEKCLRGPTNKDNQGKT